MEWIIAILAGFAIGSYAGGWSAYMMFRAHIGERRVFEINRPKAKGRGTLDVLQIAKDLSGSTTTGSTTTNQESTEHPVKRRRGLIYKLKNKRNEKKSMAE